MGSFRLYDRSVTPTTLASGFLPGSCRLAPTVSSRYGIGNAKSATMPVFQRRMFRAPDLRLVCAASDKEALMVNKPLSMLDVDPELWAALDLCSDDELSILHKLIHSRSPFSPLLKSLCLENEPALLDKRGRLSVMHKIEADFRLLAADSTTFIRGKRPNYRDTLLRIVDKLNIQCSSNLTTPDLEIEVYWHVLNECLDYVQSQGVVAAEESEGEAAQMGDGMTSTPRSSSGKRNWTERLTAPLKFGFNEVMETIAKVGGVVTVSAAGQRAAAQLGAQVVSHQMRYQLALQTAAMGAKGGLAVWQKQALLQGAQQQLVRYSAQYSATRGMMSLLGPAMWAWLFADLAFKAMGTDYARVINVVFMLAQVRLYRTHGFVNPEPEEKEPPTGHA